MKRLVVPVIFILNALVFSWWTVWPRFSLEFMAENFLVSWDALSEGRFWVLLTAVFSHNMFWHFALNMMVLLNFGGLLVQVLGARRFLRFYLVAGIVSSIAHALVSAFVVGDPSIPALGASGALAGLILLFCLLFPTAKIYLLFFLPLPAIFGAVIFIGLDLWGLWAQAGGGGLPIGHGAHLGGAFTGIIYYFWVLRPRLRRRPDFGPWT